MQEINSWSDRRSFRILKFVRTRKEQYLMKGRLNQQGSQCPNLQTQFSRKPALNACFQLLQTSILDLSSRKLGLKIQELKDITISRNAIMNNNFNNSEQRRRVMTDVRNNARTIQIKATIPATARCLQHLYRCQH